MISLGIDLGSNTVKAVLLKDGKEVLATSVRKGTYDPQAVADEVVADCVAAAGIARADIGKVVATGYGRISCAFADKEISEISCHGRGAYFTLPSTRTIIDIGGQDSKVIVLSENGKVTDFIMNDKCAAGTGRFLEVMASALGLELSQFGPIALQSTKPIEITNTCTVFAESEVISLLARKTAKEDIIAGLHRSIASRVLALASRLSTADDVMATGGVALNSGVVAALETASGRKIKVPPMPQLNGALGAALYASEMT